MTLLIRTILLTFAMLVSSLVFAEEVVLSGMILIAIALTTVLMVLGPTEGDEDPEARQSHVCLRPLGVCPRIRSWRRKSPRNNLLTVIWTLSWSN